MTSGPPQPPPFSPPGSQRQPEPPMVVPGSTRAGLRWWVLVQGAVGLFLIVMGMVWFWDASLLEAITDSYWGRMRFWLDTAIFVLLVSVGVDFAARAIRRLRTP